MREIILDTETTGLDPNSDRLVEVAAVEIDGMAETGRVFHRYYDPERPIPYEATKIHGMTWDDLKGKPVFADEAAELAGFLDGATLVIQNASFDMGFLRAEFSRAGIACNFGPVVDTLQLARRRFPSGGHSLDALCDKFGIDRSARAGGHGGLIDVQLLHKVYVALTGRDQLIPVDVEAVRVEEIVAEGFPASARQNWFPDRRSSMPPLLTEEEDARHAAFVAGFKSPSIWTVGQQQAV